MFLYVCTRNHCKWHAFWSSLSISSEAYAIIYWHTSLLISGWTCFLPFPFRSSITRVPLQFDRGNHRMHGTEGASPLSCSRVSCFLFRKKGPLGLGGTWIQCFFLLKNYAGNTWIYTWLNCENIEKRLKLALVISIQSPCTYFLYVFLIVTHDGGLTVLFSCGSSARLRSP